VDIKPSHRGKKIFHIHPALSMKIWKGGMKPNSSEFLFMAISSQTFFAFMRSHFMPFTLFTTGQEFSPPLRLFFMNAI
jgi:hypothetical protein